MRSLAQDMLPNGSGLAGFLADIIRAGEHAAHLTGQLLAYSGQGQFLIEPIDLSEMVREVLSILQPSIPKRIGVQLDLRPNLPPIEADRGQLRQVFMNLVHNASEAIGDNPGLISVRTGVQHIGEGSMRGDPSGTQIMPGAYVTLAVRDTGCGMDENTKAKIFDPFFTTKFLGRGLGLAAVAGIVRAHKAAIAVNSEPGEGACFTVVFPCRIGRKRF